MTQSDLRPAKMADGGRVAYEVTGAGGSPVVLLHGGTGTRRDWDAVARALSERHVVVAVDMIGFGDSDRPPGRYTPGRLADSVICVMDELEIDSAHLVGHSVGGRVAVEVARRHPGRTDRLVLVAPMGFGRLTAPGFMLGLIHWAAHRLTLRPLPYPDLELVIDDADLRRSVGITADTRVLWGARDAFLPSRYAGRVTSAIPGATSHIFDGAGHAPHREIPEQLAEDLIEFLSGREIPSVSARRP